MPDPVGRSGMIARFTGKAFVAFGFILGTYGLTEGNEAIKQTALGLLVAGILAMAYGMYHWARYRGVTTDHDRSNKQ
jgi:hypothetical protein